MLHPLLKLRDGHLRQLSNILTANLELQRLRFQTRTTTFGTGLHNKELLAPLFTTLRILVDIAHHPLREAHPLTHSITARCGELCQIYGHWLRIAVENCV